MFATFLSVLIRDRTCSRGYLSWRGYYAFSILQPLAMCPKFLYSADELLALRNFDVRPARPVRKCIFHYQLWFPRYDRLQYSIYVNENRTTCSHRNCQTNGRVYQRTAYTAVTDTVTAENRTVSSQRLILNNLPYLLSYKATKHTYKAGSIPDSKHRRLSNVGEAPSISLSTDMGSCTSIWDTTEMCLTQHC